MNMVEFGWGNVHSGEVSYVVMPIFVVAPQVSPQVSRPIDTMSQLVFMNALNVYVNYKIGATMHSEEKFTCEIRI